MTDAAVDSGPKGIGGWLLLPLLGLIVSPIRMTYSISTDLFPLLNSNAWTALTSSSSPAYHPLWAPLIIFELVGNGAVLMLGLLVLAAFLSKLSVTPKLFVAWIGSFVVLQLVDLALSSQIPQISANPDNQAFKDLGRSIVGAAIWIPYFLTSKRVANTFVA